MGSQKIAGLAGGLIVGAGLLLAPGPAEAEWRYTDDKGKTRTVCSRWMCRGSTGTARYTSTSALARTSRAAPSQPSCPR